MSDRKVEVRRTGKEHTLLAAGVVHKDGTVEAFIAGQQVNAPDLASFEAACEGLSSTGVDVVVTP